MTRRPGKDPQTHSTSFSPPQIERTTPRTHFRCHVHLTNNIHIKHLHMHVQTTKTTKSKSKSRRMLDGRQTPHLPLRRELTAVRKVKSLRDPSTSSSFSPVSVGSSVTRAGRVINDDAAQSTQQEPAPRRAGRSRNKSRDHGSNAVHQGEARQSSRGGGHGRVLLQEDGTKRKDTITSHGGFINKGRDCNGSCVENPTYGWDGELEIGEGLQEELRGRGGITRRRDCSEYIEASSPHHHWQEEEAHHHHHHQNQNYSSHSQQQHHHRDHHHSTLPRNNGIGYRVEERWAGDAEEIARRLIAEQNVHMASPNSYLSNLTRQHGMSLLGLGGEITTSEAEESFLESEEGEAAMMGSDHHHHHHHHQAGMSSSHMSNSESPLVRRKTHHSNGNNSSRRSKDHQGMMNLRVGGVHSRGNGSGRARSSARRALHNNVGMSYKEAPVVPTMSDELDVSEMPQNGCGMPWYFSGLHKYKGKSLLDYAGMGFTCAFPEGMKSRKGDSKDVSRNGSRNGSQRDMNFSCLEEDANVVPLLTPGEESYDEGEEDLPELMHSGDPPKREVISVGKSTRVQQKKEQVVVMHHEEGGPMADASSGGGPHRSLSQKYRPKSFKDLVGQSLVVKSLTTAITKGRVAPVYLFTGPQGTGKTSAARIFAAALVCLNTEPHRRPCGLCRECATLTLNRSQDVKEMDVSSSPDLLYMRSLVGTINLPPTHTRQRIFIVEGCDSLSADIWNAFLKILEDPLHNVVFILITSEFERLPVSATSRCQKYHFGKVKEAEIVGRLQALVEKENLDAEETALSLIAMRADGSLRDAETILDQLSLLDRVITLSMVQELVGLIPDNKLLDLLDMALAADTVNTVKGMRDLLESGVDALSLVAQLASLITNIIVGTFELRRDGRKKGFFRRNLPRGEEQQRLRQALKVLAECEKQLRASSDRSTWLTAALLQFAPDRSYLPSSVDTSMAPSPIAFDTLEKVATGEPDTPRLPHPPPGDPRRAATSRKAGQQIHSPNNNNKDKAHHKVPRVIHNTRTEKQKLHAPSGNSSSNIVEGRRTRGVPHVAQAKVHPSTAESPSHIIMDDDDDGSGLPPSRSLVLFDPARISGTRDFRVLSRRDLEDIWGKVLDGCRSNVLRQLLSSQGTLMALFVARDDTYAVAHVEFRSQEHKARAERLRSSTCHAFQMALGCPVELKLSLECPPNMVLEEIKASQPLRPDPSTSGAQADQEPEFIPTALTSVENDIAPAEPSLRHTRRRRKRPDAKEELISTGSKTAAVNQDQKVDEVAGPSTSAHSGSRNKKSSSQDSHCFSTESCMPREATRLPARRQRSVNRGLNRVTSVRREGCGGNISQWNRPKFKGLMHIERKNMRLQARHKPARGPPCWHSPQSEKLFGAMAPKSPKAPAPAKAATKTPPRQYRKPTPMDPISANKVWKEHCDKCDAIPALQGPFQLDPRTMYLITEKPTRVQPTVKVSQKEYEDAVKLMMTVDPIKNRELAPPDKYEEPLTVAQEYGWFKGPLMKPNPLFNFPRHACEITEYADAYYMSQGMNPFARKQPIVGQGGKGKAGAVPKGGKEAAAKSPPKKK